MKRMRLYQLLFLLGFSYSLFLSFGPFGEPQVSDGFFQFLFAYGNERWLAVFFLLLIPYCFHQAIRLFRPKPSELFSYSLFLLFFMVQLSFFGWVDIHHFFSTGSGLIAFLLAIDSLMQWVWHMQRNKQAKRPFISRKSLLFLFYSFTLLALPLLQSSNTYLSACGNHGCTDTWTATEHALILFHNIGLLFPVLFLLAVKFILLVRLDKRDFTLFWLNIFLLFHLSTLPAYPIWHQSMPSDLTHSLVAFSGMPLFFWMLVLGLAVETSHFLYRHQHMKKWSEDAPPPSSNE